LPRGGSSSADLGIPGAKISSRLLNFPAFVPRASAPGLAALLLSLIVKLRFSHG